MEGSCCRLVGARVCVFVGLLSGAMGFGCSTGIGDTRDTVRSSQAAILNGELAPDMDAVFLVGHEAMGCTGTLIAPDVILTARHCLASVAENPDCYGTAPATMKHLHAVADVFVVRADSVSDPHAAYLDVAELVSLPLGGERPVCGADALAIRLAKPITDIAPVEVRAGIQPLVHEKVVVAGFGNITPKDEDSWGTRRRATTHVDHVGARNEGLTTKMVVEDFSVEQGPCQGDSGGPALDDGGRLIGVMSRGNSSKCEGMVYTGVSFHRDWLVQLARESALRTKTEVPDWARDLTPATQRFGESCRADAECEAPHVCRSVGGALQCVTRDCSQCPSDSVCEEASGSPACIKKAAQDAGPDAAEATDSGTEASPLDAHEEGPADASAKTEAPRVTSSDDTGCGIARSSGQARWTYLLALALMALGRARTRRQTEQRYNT